MKMLYELSLNFLWSPKGLNNLRKPANTLQKYLCKFAYLKDSPVYGGQNSITAATAVLRGRGSSQ